MIILPTNVRATSAPHPHEHWLLSPLGWEIGGGWGGCPIKALSVGFPRRGKSFLRVVTEHPPHPPPKHTKSGTIREVKPLVVSGK